ncbi:MAG: hypothetical protein VCC68_12125 [Myxococcota bacterium]
MRLAAPTLQCLIGALGIPVFAAAEARAFDPAEVALEHLRTGSQQRRSAATDTDAAATFAVREIGETRRGGLSVVRVEQRRNGLAIHGEDISLVLARDGRVLRQHGRAARRGRVATPAPEPGISAAAALQFAAASVGLVALAPPTPLGPAVGVARLRRRRS